MDGVAPGGPAAAAGFVPLGQVATIQPVAGPMVVRTENAELTSWVYVDVQGRDIGSFVTEARRTVDAMVSLPPGYRLEWSGQYEYMEAARERLLVVAPATLLIIFLLLYLNFRSAAETTLVLLSLPFALVGGLWLVTVYFA